MPAINPYFGFSDEPEFGGEQELIQDLIDEAIGIHGMDIQYLPKTLVNLDQLFGEDTLKTFNSAYTIPVYLEGATGPDGVKAFLNSFGGDIRRSTNFLVSKRAFADAIKITGANSIPNPSPDDSYVRPMEGDLIYFPLTHDIWEVKDVDPEAVFYQLGKTYVFRLTVEKFVYSHERLQTGNTKIDKIATNLANNNSVANDPLADNTFVENAAQSILNPSVTDPFSGGSF